jgi:4'-phosphopantetheinyl transferase
LLSFRQHVRMHSIQGRDVAAMAAGLSDDAIHVWRIRYDRVRKREPLLALLGAYLGLSADAVRLTEGEHGRPELVAPWHARLQFNWSHTTDAALIAVARGLAPGVDIERVRPRARSMELAGRFFHPDETAALAALDIAERERAFLQLWTAKEATLKAMGRGIAFGLHRLRLTVAPEIPRVIWIDGDDAGAWQLHSVPVDAGHVASLAWRGPARAIEAWTLAEDA